MAMRDAGVAWAKEGAPSLNGKVNVLVVRSSGAPPSFFAMCHTLSDFLNVAKKELRAVVD
jgi:predicted phosphoribosyltransferase